MDDFTIGEAVSEGEAERALQADCDCKAGMFPNGQRATASRRQILRGGGLLTAAAAILPARAALAADALDPPWSVPGAIAKSDYGSRAPFEKVARLASFGGTSSLTPLQASTGIITPSGLHFERHHNGIPAIDPDQHRLIIHGMVDKPMKYSVEDLKRFPSISRILFVECSGNSNAASRSASPKTAQEAHGLTSTSEWTGVRLSTLLAQVGVKDGAAWVLAEGADGAMLSRSVPIDKMLDDAFVAYAQNGEAIRPENGYPLRLILPGWEGNINIKWLRRLKIGDKPFMTREETSKYSDLITLTGKARQFSWVMEAKSLDHFSVGRHAAAGQGLLRNHRPGLVGPRADRTGRSHHRWRQELASRRAAGTGAGQGACAVPLSLDVGRQQKPSSKAAPPTRPVMSSRPRRFSPPPKASAPLIIITASRAGRSPPTGA